MGVVITEPLGKRLALRTVAQALHAQHLHAEKAARPHIAEADKSGRIGSADQQSRKHRRDQHDTDDFSRAAFALAELIAKRLARALQKCVFRVVERQEEHFFIQHNPSSFR